MSGKYNTHRIYQRYVKPSQIMINLMSLDKTSIKDADNAKEHYGDS